MDQPAEPRQRHLLCQPGTGAVLGVALSLVWPFIHVRWRRKSEVPADLAVAAAPSAGRSQFTNVDFFGVATILRSLILFNLLFAVQTVLDVIYLWGNATLPADISYAAYAHRGAYPLIVTALLAAGFVLIAMRPGGPAEQSKVIRPLVYLWVAQNVLLVASSILRLDLYVQIYLLTWWRVAAFIWMLLVAFGLLLIVARIALNRSNEWLIRANLITLTATLYICSLVNFAAIIADYNVDHSREVAGKGVSDRHELSVLPRTAGIAGHRQGHCPSRVRSHPCFPPRLPCRTAPERDGFLAQLGLSELAAAAHPGRPTEEFDHRLTSDFRRDL